MEIIRKFIHYFNNTKFSRKISASKYLQQELYYKINNMINLLVSWNSSWIIPIAIRKCKAVKHLLKDNAIKLKKINLWL
jgi:hypothetical protein